MISCIPPDRLVIRAWEVGLQLTTGKHLQLYSHSMFWNVNQAQLTSTRLHKNDRKKFWCSCHFLSAVLIHTVLEKFSNAALFPRSGIPSTLIRQENEGFWKRSSKRLNLLMSAFRFSVGRKRFENSAFLTTMTSPYSCDFSKTNLKWPVFVWVSLSIYLSVSQSVRPSISQSVKNIQPVS